MVRRQRTGNSGLTDSDCSMALSFRHDITVRHWEQVVQDARQKTAEWHVSSSEEKFRVETAFKLGGIILGSPACNDLEGALRAELREVLHAFIKEKASSEKNSSVDYVERHLTSNGSDDIVRWKKFRSLTKLKQYNSLPTGCEDHVKCGPLSSSRNATQSSKNLE
eukprot:6206168-Amphidinium_carterae.3